MKWTTAMRRRHRWERWKARNEGLSLFLATPVLVPVLVVFVLYRLYLSMCCVFGWKPWRLP